MYEAGRRKGLSLKYSKGNGTGNRTGEHAQRCPDLVSPAVSEGGLYSLGLLLLAFSTVKLLSNHIFAHSLHSWLSNASVQVKSYSLNVTNTEFVNIISLSSCSA